MHSNEGTIVELTPVCGGGSFGMALDRLRQVVHECLKFVAAEFGALSKPGTARIGLPLVADSPLRNDVL